jgi:sulfopyruvate decarboxylase subunit beta
MQQTLARQAKSGTVVKGSSIIGSIKAAGVDTVVALPDIVTCENVLWPIARDEELFLVPICKEDEGISICAGLSYCDRRAVLLIQHTGFLDSINAIRAIAVDYQLPIVMIVGLQGLEADRAPAASEKLGVRIMEPMMRSMGLDYTILDQEEDAAAMASTIEASYATSKPHVFLVARSPV